MFDVKILNEITKYGDFYMSLIYTKYEVCLYISNNILRTLKVYFVHFLSLLQVIYTFKSLLKTIVDVTVTLHRKQKQRTI